MLPPGCPLGLSALDGRYNEALICIELGAPVGEQAKSPSMEHLLAPRGSKRFVAEREASLLFP